MSWTYLDLEMEEIELGERVSWCLAVEVSLRGFPMALIEYRIATGW